MDPGGKNAEILLIHVHNRKRIQFNLSGIYPMLPLGITMLGAALEKAGKTVELLDLSLSENFNLDVGQYVLEKGFVIAGLSATVFSLPETVSLASQISRKAPQCKVVVGGPGNIFPQETLHQYIPGADIFVYGEGENVLVDLANSDWSENGLELVKGISYKQGDQVKITSPATVAEMDSLPFPARHLLETGKYSMHPPFNRYPPITLIETSRGCPYHCSFCSLPKTWRTRSVSHLMNEIDQVIDGEKVREIHFVDPTFTADKDRAIAIANEMGKRHIHYTFKTRIDLVDRNMLEVFASTGCYMISYGVETFNEKDMAYLNKQFPAQKAVENLKMTKKAGVDVLAYMLVGNPMDDTFTVISSVRKLISAKADFALFSDLFPDPQAKVTKQALDRGLLTARQINDFYFKQIPYPGKLTQAGHPYRLVKTWVAASFFMFYFSPRTIFRILGKPQTYTGIKEIVKAGFQLIGDFIFKGRTISA